MMVVRESGDSLFGGLDSKSFTRRVTGAIQSSFW
jgi:hypothetical protein